MSDRSRDEASGRSATQGSGSDTLSAAAMNPGTATGSAGRPQNSPYQSSGPDRSGRSAGGASEGMSEMARNAAESVRQTTGDLRERTGETMEQATQWARDHYQEGTRQMDDVRKRSMQQMERARGGIERFVSENPMMVGVMGLAAGLLIGALLPRTRQEDRFFGQWADDLRDQGVRYAKEAAQRSRELVEEAVSGAGDYAADEDRGESRSSGPRYQNH